RRSVGGPRRHAGGKPRAGDERSSADHESSRSKRRCDSSIARRVALGLVTLVVVFLAWPRPLLAQTDRTSDRTTDGQCTSTWGVSRDGDSGSWSQSSAATCDRDFGIAANWFRVSRTEGASTRSELGLAGFVTVGGYEIFARMPRVSIQQSTGGATFNDYPFV